MGERTEVHSRETGRSGPDGRGVDAPRAEASDAGGSDVDGRGVGEPSETAADGGPAARRASRPFNEEARLREREANLRAYAHLLDSAVRLPGGFRVGLDGLVGLVPVIGDLVGVGLSGYLVVAAARLGIPRTTLVRMIGNVAIESTVGMIPILGDAFDFFFKANERNVRLLERELDRRAGVEPGSRPRD